jgi:hypothetical protein
MGFLRNICLCIYMCVIDVEYSIAYLFIVIIIESSVMNLKMDIIV